MTKKRPPSPPSTDNPIVFLRSMSEERKLEREYEFLSELLDAHEAGDVDRAAKCATSALSATLDREMVNAMVSLVNNLAYAEDQYPASLKTLLCKAADAGFHEYAYNAANQVMEGAKGVKGYKEAERYFKLAMSFDEKPELQAAAHVNYCPIVRDGMITGSPDWVAAVEIYEVAARMGLVKAMFNAGNVSSWLANKGDRAYGARAAYWCKYALDYRASGKPRLDMETLEELEEVFDQAALLLSACHIDNKFDGADVEEGIRWARKLTDQGDPAGRDNLAVGYLRRLMGLTAKPQNSPGPNWRSVLSRLDWRFKGDFVSHSIPVSAVGAGQSTVAVDELLVELGTDKTIPLFVTHDPCLPQRKGFERLADIAATLAAGHPEGFFLQTRKALFFESKGRAYTPIYVFHQGRLHRQALSMVSSPVLLLQCADDGVDFLDERFGNWNCAIPIVVNTLDEGFVVADNADLGQPWVGVGGPWRMPFLDEGKLLDLGIVLQRYRGPA